MPMHRELIEDINRLDLPPGAVAFWWIGQMSYIVKIGSTVFYFDPYLAPRETRQVPPMLLPAEVTNADWVFGSHDHSDHIDPTAISGITQASPRARFVCSRVNRARVGSLSVPDERIVALDDGWAHEADGVTITAVAAQHEFFDRHAELGYPHLCFILECGGATVFHSGDTLKYDGLSAKLSRWKFDVVFLPINGRDAVRFARKTIGNMTYQEAVDLAGDIQPRLTVPGHYDMFRHNGEDPKKFTDYMDVKFPHLKYRVGPHGEAVVLPARQ
jgi:L-ascorbate metabolism protein UlaG (beta-lactamase superfamily)